MFAEFLKQGLNINISENLIEKYNGTTIEKIYNYLKSHWGIYNQKMDIIIFPESENEFDVEMFINSWKTKAKGDFIEERARKCFHYKLPIRYLLNFALYAFNNKSLSITYEDVEILFYVMFIHVKYNVSYCEKTIELLKKILRNEFLDDYILILCYIFLELLPNNIIEYIKFDIIDRLSKRKQINLFKSLKKIKTILINIFLNLKKIICCGVR